MARRYVAAILVRNEKENRSREENSPTLTKEKKGWTRYSNTLGSLLTGLLRRNMRGSRKMTIISLQKPQGEGNLRTNGGKEGVKRDIF